MPEPFAAGPPSGENGPAGEQLTATCEKLPTCRFFNETMASMPASAAIMERQYCDGDSGSCARIMVADTLGRDLVPPDLAPNDVTRAKRILDTAWA